jgi:hypothetical protein
VRTLNKKTLVLILVLLVSVILLTGCVPGDQRFTNENPAGFFWGIWHGWIAPVSLAIGFFDRDVRIYEPDNTGWFYDLGFYISIIAGFGGVSLFRKKGKK